MKATVNSNYYCYYDYELRFRKCVVFSELHFDVIVGLLIIKFQVCVKSECLYTSTGGVGPCSLSNKNINLMKTTAIGSNVKRKP